MDGGRELSHAWTEFTRFVLLKERPPEGYTWSGRRLTRNQTTSRPDDVWPDMWKFMFDAAKKKAKQRWAIEKPKLENARQLRGIFFMEPNDEEFKLTMKAGRRKLEVPMPAAMPCKIPIKSSGETHRNIGKRKTKYACVVDADERTRPRLEGAGHKPHQDHITAKRMNSITHYCLVRISIPMPQALKTIPDDNAAVSKSRPAAMNLFSSIATSSSSASSPIASKKSGDADGFGETRQQDENKSKLIRRTVDFSSD